MPINPLDSTSITSQQQNVTQLNQRLTDYTRNTDPHEMEVGKFLLSISSLLICAPAIAMGIAALCSYVGAAILHSSGHDRHHANTSAQVGALGGVLAGSVGTGVVFSAMVLRRAGLFSQSTYQGAKSSTLALNGVSYFVGLYAAFKILKDHLNIHETYGELLADNLLGSAVVGGGFGCLAIAFCCCGVLCLAKLSSVSVDEEAALEQVALVRPGR